MAETRTKTNTKTVTNTFMVRTAIRRWGNSQGIRLSKDIINRMNLKENDEVGINIDNGKMVIEKVGKPKYLNLKERLESFYQKPIEEIFVDSSEEIDTGDPVGEELW